MKILFATGELNTWFSATNKIAFQVAAKLSEKGHSCALVGISVDSKENETTQQNVRLIRLNSTAITDRAAQKFEKYCSDNKEKTRQQLKKSFTLSYPLSSLVLMYKYSPFFKAESVISQYKKQIKKVILKETPDCIIATYMPFFEAASLFEIPEIKCPIYLYQMDPWGLHRSPELCCDKQLHIEQETNIFTKAKHIITTPVLLRQYSQDKNYISYIDKMTDLDFPNIRKIEKNDTVNTAFEFDKNYTNILFCGIIEDEYRSPKKFLEEITSLENFKSDIKIYFLGINTSKTLKKYIEKYPDNIIYHQQVSVEIAIRTMQEADILLNINNTNDNQVPSKIFDYFSIGKPIINVQKIKDCPSREYFDNYPLAVTIEDYKEDNLQQLEEFLQKDKDVSIEYQKVEKIFSTATIDYAAQKIENIITDFK